MTSESRITLPIHVMGVVAGALLTGLAAVLIFGPMGREYAEAAAQQRQRGELRDRTVHSHVAVRKLEKQLSEARHELETGTVDLEPAEKLNRRLAGVTGLLEDSGMVIESTEFGEALHAPWYRLVPIRVDGTGGYADVARFFHELHLTMPDTGILAFELSGNPEQADAPPRFQIDLVWYAAPSLAAVPDSD